MRQTCPSREPQVELPKWESRAWLRALGFQGLGFRVSGFQGLEFQGLGSKVLGLGFEGCRIDLGLRDFWGEIAGLYSEPAVKSNCNSSNPTNQDEA